MLKSQLNKSYLILCISVVALEIYQKETLVQVFSCEFYKIFKNIFLNRTPLVAASNAFKLVLTWC